MLSKFNKEKINQKPNLLIAHQKLNTFFCLNNGGMENLNFYIFEDSTQNKEKIYM